MKFLGKMKDSGGPVTTDYVILGVLGGGAPREKILRKIKDSGGPEGGAPRTIAENELKLPLSMGKKIIEIP